MFINLTPHKTLNLRCCKLNSSCSTATCLIIGFIQLCTLSGVEQLLAFNLIACIRSLNGFANVYCWSVPAYAVPWRWQKRISLPKNEENFEHPKVFVQLSI